MSPVLNTASKLYVGTNTVSAVYAGTNKVWPSGFNASSIAGLRVWLDAAQLTGADGAAVSPWPNLAAGGPPGTMIASPPPKISTNKLKGQKLVRFTVDQGAMRMTSVGARQDYTIAYIGRVVASGTLGRVLTTDYPGDDGINNWLVGFHPSGYDWFYDNGNVSTPVAWDANGYLWKLYSVDSTPTEQRMFVNGVMTGDRTAAAAGIGGRLNISGYQETSAETCDCEIAEVLLYNRKLPDVDRQSIENYLRNKWLIPGPVAVPGLVWWLNATTLTGADGSALATWPDSGGKGHNCAALGTSPKLAHVGGKQVVDMTNARMTASGLGTEMSGRANWSIAWAVMPTDYSSYPIMLTAPTAALWDWILELHVSGGVYVGQTNAHYAEFEPGASVNTWSRGTVTVAGTTRRAWMNGTEMAVSFMGPSGDILSPIPALGADAILGGYYTGGPSILWAGYMGEFLIYDHALTDTERQTVETYLQGKWL